MNSEPIIIESTFLSPVGAVWKAITDKDSMKIWYFVFEAFRPEVGFEFQFMGGKDDRQYLHLCKITEAVPNKKLVYSWRYDGYEGISYVTFELTSEGDSTTLKLTHSGLESFPSSNPDFTKENFVEGWTYLIGTSLNSFLK